ncbi:MAG TPA: UDP-3-O-(3-hydroxymyristoyl)glucosamine N-acyltransferase [Desulfovibrio sp.]|nr:UDP-3-O-(3-hydroxymyristoyl)glucosamine N-acyltransferase [Desulfovibrio sp.]
MNAPRDVFVHAAGICESASVGPGTRIWAFAHVLPGAVIGRDANICDHVFIEGGVTLGDRVTVKCHVALWEGVAVGDDVFIGPFVEVQSGVRVGDRCRIQSHSFICELVTIGNDCVVAHGVMFINDLFETGGPARGRRALWRATTIGNNVSIGSNATILPVAICDHVVIGAGSVVTRDIVEPGIYAGNPARLLRPLASPGADRADAPGGIEPNG